MRIIEDKLKSDNKILTVWFNAWRYEREDQFAIIALMKTIAYAMGEHPIYKELKPILLRAVKIITKGFLSEVASRYIGEKGVAEFKTKLLPKMDFLAEVDRDTIYFDGMNKIEMEMAKIMKKYDGSRVIVFIDDLDRCSPKKALEVFESVKVFLGLEGFMYIIGLSHETISKLITAEYQNSGIKGEQYIRKIIQIPITIPEWNDIDIKDLIRNLSTKLDDKYKGIIEKNIEEIATAVELNPREVKRFIVAHEIYSKNNKVEAKELLLVQALKVRWNKFYSYISSDSDDHFKEEIKKYIDKSEDERNKIFDDRKNDKNNPPTSHERKIFTFESDNELWPFLKKNKDIIFNIKEWKVYRRAVESMKEIPVPDDKPLKSKILELLLAGNISEFNRLRQQSYFPLDLEEANLWEAYLQRADLQEANLRGAYLQGASLQRASLQRADLQGADLTGANLQEAKLQKLIYRELILARPRIYLYQKNMLKVVELFLFRYTVIDHACDISRVIIYSGILIN
jgi:KAP family P-loop domain/Pentapeptide repeats (8 copies)